MDTQGGQGQPAARPPLPERRSAFRWGDFFAFRLMVTPVLIRLVYAIGVVLITLAAILVFVGTPVTTCVSDSAGSTTCTGGGPGSVLSAVVIAVVVFVVGQLYWRVITELLYVIFGIHESVRAIERGTAARMRGED